MKGRSRIGLVYVAAIFLGCFGSPKTAAAGPFPELWFPVGETLTYDMHYGLMHVGETLVTSEWINEGGKLRLAIRFFTKTNKFFDKVYRVENVVESIIDPETFQPVRMHKKISEGDFASEETTTFDFENLVAHWSSVTKKQSRDYKLSPDARDIVSFMFIMRQVPLDGERLGSYWVTGDDGMCRLQLKGRGTADVDLDVFGRVMTTRLVPVVTRDALFVRKMPRMLWVSTDARRLIVKMTVKVPIASITLTLKNVTGPGDDFWTQKSGNAKPPVLAHD